MKRRIHLLASTAAIIAASLGASGALAQTAPTVVDGNNATGKVVTGNTALAATNTNIVGPNASIGNANNQTVYTGFRTTGGSGSGGGAGLGGVFFIDNGASLTLTNVSFANNTVTGGQGGGVRVDSAAPIAFSVAGTSTDASAYVQYNTGVNATYVGNDTVQVNSLSLSQQNTLFGVGSGVGTGKGAAYTSSISGTTINADGSETLTLAQPLNLTVGNGLNKVTVGDGTNNNPWTFTSAAATSIQAGMNIVGTGIPQGAVVNQISRDANNNITSITANDANGNSITLAAGSSFYVVNAQTYDFSRIASSYNNSTSSTTLTSTGPLAGFAVGMTVMASTGVPAGTTVTGVTTTTDPDTGATITTITTSQPINLLTATDLKASFNPLVSNTGQAVLNLASVAGLSVGQGVSGIGIPAGTRISAISGNIVTLSTQIGQAAVNAISSSNLLLTVDPVVASSAGSVTLTSVGSFNVGDAITGNGIPANAKITGISGNTISYVIDPTLASANAGGSMNSLAAPGTVGTSGGNGQTGTTYSATFDNGEGAPGTNATSGRVGANNVGGNGGNGGSGSNASSTNKTLITTLSLDAASLVADFLSTADDAAGLFTLPSVPGDILHTAVDAAHVVFDTTQLVAWQIAEKQGLVALGGSGGQGGNGGAGSTFFGGGMGGNGGNGGNGAESVSLGGAGGSGGTGGAGGFGAGGGNGGAGGVAGANGVTGSAGSGGTAGFGGGAGSSAAEAGQGGSGFGGAIFVRNGGTLTISGNAVFQNNAALAGSSSNGGSAGSSAGSDLFMMTGSTVNLTPGVGSTITFYDSIADDSSASIGGSIAAGQGARLNVGGGGTVQLFGTDTYTGATNISGATLEAQDGTGINPYSQIEFSGAGTIGNGLSTATAGVLLSGGTITRAVGTGPTNVYFAGSGGFAGTSGNLLLNFGSLNAGNGPTLVWGAGGFVPVGKTLVFGSDAADATGTVTLQNAINLAGNTGMIAVYHNSGESASYDAAITGAISNGTLIVGDAGYSGTLLLSGQNSLGGVTLNNGTVSTVNGNQTGRLMNAASGGFVQVNAGTLILGGAEKLTSVNVAAPGSVLAAGAVNAGAISNAGTSAFGSTLNAASIDNAGVLGLMGTTGVAGTIVNEAGGILRQLATTNAAAVTNNGSWTLGGDLTSGTVANNGEIDVVGTVPNGSEVAATRTIHTAGLSGNAAAVINLGGVAGATANTLVLDQSGSSTYAGAFSGAGALTKTGSGTLLLTGASSFTGGLAINAGAIDTTGGGTLADTLAVTVAQGAGFRVGTADTIGSIQNAGTVVANANLGLVTLGNTGVALIKAGLTASGDVTNAANARLSFTGSSNAAIGGGLNNAGIVTAAGGLSVAGLVTNQAGGTIALAGSSTPGFGSLTNAGTITADAALTVGGAYTQNAGTLNADANLSTGSFSGSGGAVALANGSTFAINQTADGTYLGSVGGNGVVTKSGSATLTLAGASDSVAPSALAVQAGGVTAQTAGVLDQNLTVTVGQPGTLTLNADQGVASVLSNGTVILAANLTTSGTVADNGLLTVAGGGTARSIHTAGFTGAAGGVADLGSNALTLDQSGNSTYAGMIVGAGSLVKTGAGALTLTGASSFTGGLTVAAGTIDTTGGGTLADTLSIGVAQGATMIVGTADRVGTVTNAGTLIANADYGVASLANSGSGTLGGNFVAAAAVGNTGALAFNGANARIGGDLTNSGTVQSNAALVVLGTVANIGGLTLAGPSAQVGGGFTNSGTAQSNGTLAVGSDLANTGGLTLAGSAAQVGGGFINSGTVQSNGTLTVAGTLANTGGLTLAGSAAQVGGGFTNGGTVQSNGTLVVGSDLANTGSLTLAGSSATVGGGFANAGTGTASVAGQFTVAGTSSNDGQLVLAAGSAAYLAGTLSNTGTLTGAGTLAVAGAVSNAQGGTVSLIAGGATQLASLANAGALTADSPLSVIGAVANSGTMLLDAGSAPQFGSLANTGTITTGDTVTIAGAYRQDAGTVTANGNLSSGSLSGAGGAIVLNGASGYAINQTVDASYAGSIGGSGTVAKAGPATLTLAGGQNSVTPSALAVLAGGVVVQQAYALGQSLVVGVAAPGTLTLNASQSIASLTSDGRVLLGGDLSTIGGIISNGMLTVTGDASTTRTVHTTSFAGGSAGEVKLGGADGTVTSTLVIDQSGNSTYAGIFTGAGSLTKTGAGTLTLTGASGFTGGLTVAAGTIDTTGGGTFADTLDVGVAQGATMIVGTADVVRGVTNAGTLTANADYGVASLGNSGTASLNGNLAVAGTLANTGTLTLNGGTTQVGGAFTNAGNAVANGTLLVGGALTNTGGLALNGAATQVGGAFTNAGNAVANSTLSVGGTLTNTGSLALNGVATQVGGDVANGGTMQVAGQFGVAGNLSTSGQITVQATSATHVAGNVANSGSFVSNGALAIDGQLSNAQGASVALAGTGSTLGAVANAGTLAATAPLAVSGAVSNSGTVTFATGAAVQVGSLTNSGTVTSSDSLIVNGAYQQNGGKLTVGHGLSTGTLSGNGGAIVLANASQYVVNQASDGSYAGSIAGGTVIKLGTGTLTLAGGTDSFAPVALAIYQGGVTVKQAGALDQALSVGIATAGTLTLQANQTIHDLNGTGTLAVGTNDLTLTNGGTFSGTVTGTGNVKFATGNFTLNGAGTSTGTSFTVQPSSTLNVAANSALTTQTLTVSNAALNLQGSATATTTNVDGSTLHLGNGVDIGQSGAVLGTLASTTTAVTNGGALTGNGTITGNTVVGGSSAGTVAPGNSPGVLTFTNLTYGNMSTAAMQIDGANGAGVAGGNDLVIVTGMLTLQPGSTLAIQKSQPASSYEIPLGKGIQLFRFAPGHVTGSFGSITKSGFAGNLAFNVSNGTVYGLGSYTPDAFATAVSATPVGAAAEQATFITANGGVAQYRSGNLLGALTTALASGGNVDDVLKRWSPDAYAGIVDQGRRALLDNLPEIGGYDRLQPGRIVATGAIHNGRIDGQQAVGYSADRYNDTAYQLGFAGDLSFAQASISYGRSTGGFHGDAITSSVGGNQFGLGVSVPVTGSQALRLVARGVYGDYRSHGTRGVIGGTASFNNVRSSIVTYGGGFEYDRQSGRVWLDGSAEFLGVHQTLDGFAETGSSDGLDLFDMRRSTHNLTVAKLDGKVGYAMTPTVTAYVKAGYIHEFGNGLTAIVADGAIDPITVTVNNPGLAQDRATAGLGVQVSLSHRLQLNADASGGTQASYRVGGGVKLRF